jgi:drug/metabolite transporter (DMT)-like permease
VEAGKPLYKRWRFIFGFILNTGSEIGLSAPASLFAPLSLLAPLGGVAVVVNALLTRFGCVCGIQERLSFLEWLATLFIMGGVALVAFSGPGGDTQVRR